MTHFVLNRDNGEQVKFPMLTPFDLTLLMNELRISRKTAAVINHKLSGLNGSGEGDLKAELSAIDARKVLYSDLVAWVNTPEGQVQFILQSLRKENPNAGRAEFEAAIKIADEMLEVAASVAGMRLTQKNDGEKPDPLPVAGEKIGAGDSTAT